ncbi:MAG: DUF3822 family protein [Candidatus Cardinium sp.]|nr:DUF3822 family protein [Candidatus Cardinium sp.]
MEIFPKKLLSVVDTKQFRPDKSTHYHLLINIGAGLIKIGCLAKDSQACLLLDVYAFPVDKQHPSYIQCLEQLYDEVFFLMRKDWYSVTLSITNQKFTLLPHLLLSPKDLMAYMHVVCNVAPSEEVAVFTHALAKLSVVFAEEATVLDWFRKRYSNSRFQIIHQVNAMIEGIQLEYPVSVVPLLFIWLDKNHMHIAAHKNGKLVCYNIFAYETDEDCLSYLSAVVQVIQFERHSGKAWVGGYIDKASRFYRQLKAYMPHATLKTKIHFLSSSSRLFKKNNPSPMLYFDLVSSLLCQPYSKSKT